MIRAVAAALRPMLFRRALEPDPDRLGLLVNGRLVDVRLRRHPSARRLTLRFSTSTGDFALSAPPGTPLGTLRRFLDGQAGWAASRLAALPARVGWTAGGSVPLRGVQHRIVHLPGSRAATRAVPDGPGGMPAVEVGGLPEAVPGRIARFLRAEAAADLGRAVARHAAALGRTPTRITIRDTRSRWGSCSSAGALGFSWRLILAPPFVLDYLAAHECAHLEEMNHSARFWALTRRLCPATDEAEAWLDGNGRTLHRYG